MRSSSFSPDGYTTTRASDDGGATWHDFDFSCDRPLFDLAVTGSALYGGTWCGAVRSVDRGTTWTATTVPSPCSGSEAEKQRVYAVAAANGVVVIDSENCFGALWTSLDGGATWGRRFAKPNADGYFGVNSIVADPRHPGRFFAAGEEVWRTDDAGATWRPFNDGIDPAAGWKFALAFDAAIGRLYVGTQTAGVWYIDIAERRRAVR